MDYPCHEPLGFRIYRFGRLDRSVEDAVIPNPQAALRRTPGQRPHIEVRSAALQRDKSLPDPSQRLR